jgi:type IV pilus assembly protein PilP
LLINKLSSYSNKNTLAIILLIGLGLLNGCSSNRHVRDLQKYVEDLHKSLVSSTENVKPVALKFPAPVTFQANSERSPFEQIGESSTVDVAASPDHPLQNYSTSALKFKGTVTQSNSMIAFILAPDSKLYQVKLGDIIGKHYGKIVKIYPDRIEIEEKITDNAKLTTTRIVTLQLKDES